MDLVFVDEIATTILLFNKRCNVLFFLYIPEDFEPKLGGIMSKIV